MPFEAREKLLEEDDRPSRDRRSSRVSTKVSMGNKEEEGEEGHDSGNEEGKPKKRNNKERKFSWPIWRKLFDYTIRRKFLAFSGLLMNLCFAMAVSLLPLKVGNVLDDITRTS